MNTSPYTFAGAALVDIGRRRSSNQDRVFLDNKNSLFILSDGMGGMDAGDKAAEKIVREVPVRFRKLFKERGAPRDAGAIGEILAESLRKTSDALWKSDVKNNISSGATCCALRLADNAAVFVNLGDSRGYFLPHNGQLKKITNDHNLAARFIAEGTLTPVAAKRHFSSSCLLAYAGMELSVKPDVFIVKTKPGDRILLCSDGLHGMLSDYEIETVLSDDDTPQNLCAQFVAQANAGGGEDNIAVIVVEIRAAKGGGSKAAAKIKKNKLKVSPRGCV
jgi:serine/threonine protein phosphatase PrpC